MRTLIDDNARYAIKEMIIRALRTAPLLLLLSVSCQKDGSTPSFVRFKYPVVKDASGQVTPASVTELWVYANDKAIGVWQPERRIPVLAEGATQLKLFAGIHKNGVTDDRIKYPFYGAAVMDTVLVAGEEITLQPVFSFYTNAQWTEGFENAGNNLDLGQSQVPITFYDHNLDPQNVLVGNRSGGFVLSSATPMFRAISTGDPEFPGNGTPVFLEFDCKSDMRFLVGVRYEIDGQTFAIPYLYVSPTGSGTNMPWKHMYVDIGSQWSLSSTGGRRFYLEGQLENGATAGTVILDNLQVHF